MIAVRIAGQWLDRDYCRTDISKVIKECGQAGRVIQKPASGFCGGLGIRIWDAASADETDLRQMIASNIGDLVIQKLVVHHDSLSDIHRESVNTIRTMSLYYKNEIRILSSVLRTGVGDSRVDNISAGGISVGIYPDGRLKEHGYDKIGRKYETHPDGAVFGKYQILSYREICRIIEEQHAAQPYFGLISWDFAVDEKGSPVLIEANLSNGELDFHQFNNGPLFGELTEEILFYVYQK